MPLPLPFRHTRLFRIDQLKPRLEIELRAFSIDEMPDYVALSHRWGEEATSEVIGCNDSLMMLKPSLVAAIRNISEFVSDEAWYWVDGICIEQADEEEKAQQVKMLWKIFGDADTVLVYLGEGDEDSASAVSAIQQAARSRSRQIGPEYDAVRRLLTRAWFTRLWTMQEAILAKEMLVVCGEKSVEWRDIAYVHNFVSSERVLSVQGKSRTISRIRSPSISSITSLRQWRADNGENDAQYCAQILELMFSQSCFMEVDRVYAVLGLFPPDLMAKIDVNYSRNHCREYWKTYEQFCQALITSLGKDDGPVWDALRSIGARAYGCPGNALPWCPDFSRPRPTSLAAPFDAWRRLQEGLQTA
jgi:hypothetical protein